MSEPNQLSCGCWNIHATDRDNCENHYHCHEYDYCGYGEDLFTDPDGTIIVC